MRAHLDYNSNEYYRHYILERLKQEELSSVRSDLVRLLKDGTPRVTKKDLEAKYGRGKHVNARQTMRHPDVLDHYRRDKAIRPSPPMSHLGLAESEGSEPPDWDSLLRSLSRVKSGRESAGEYEKAIEKLLSALFYPALTNPIPQLRIHEGRKRIDITYTNVAQSGFFHWLSMHHPASHVFVECKNYDSDPANPELDQLAGRFSPSRGKFGILVCRTLADKRLFLKRCRDTGYDHRGFIVPLDDKDLQTLIAARKAEPANLECALLKQRFDKLIM